jgi:DNA invertase Pin-like site-specific DNA recombinase
LSDQERRIHGAAMVRGDKIDEILTDPGISGSVALFARPAGARLLSVLHAGDTIIAAKMDRIFRSVQDAVNTAERLRQMGVNLILVDVGTDPITEGGVSKLFFSILAAVAEFERYRIAERNIEGRKAKKSRGGFIGGAAPYGYKVYGKGSNAVLQEDEDEKRVVFRICDLANGRSLRSVARILDGEGLSGRGGKAFHPESIQRILKRAGQAS